MALPEEQYQEKNEETEDVLLVSVGKHFPRTKQPIEPNKCFILMPIQKGPEEVYQDIIKPTLTEMGLQVIRADEIYSTNPVMDDVWENIQTAGWIIADMSGRNPNVFYETGLAHAIGRDVILLVQDIEDVPFDLQHWRVILYKQTIRGGVELKENLKKTIQNDKQYAQIPIDLLTKKFEGGMIVDQTANIPSRISLESILKEYRKTQYSSMLKALPETYKRLHTRFKEIPPEERTVKCVTEVLTSFFLPRGTDAGNLELFKNKMSPQLNTDLYEWVKNYMYARVDSFSEIEKFNTRIGKFVFDLVHDKVSAYLSFSNLENQTTYETFHDAVITSLKKEFIEAALEEIYIERFPMHFDDVMLANYEEDLKNFNANSKE